MDLVYGYHITKKSNINSILKNGLVPNIGKNSIYAREHQFLIYFTSVNYINKWIQLFNINENELEILKFLCTNYIKRDVSEFFTSDSILSDNILIITRDEEIPLKEYYQCNKEILDLETIKTANKLLKQIINRLKEIEFTSMEPEPENTWQYNEVDPNLVDTMDLLKMVRSLEDKSQFVEVLNYIKDKTLKKLVENDLGITTGSVIYETLNLIFNDSLSNNKDIDLMSINIATTLISIDMQYRLLDRYERTSKKYGYDHRVWDYDGLDFERINQIVNNNSYLNQLMEETTELRNKRLNKHI